MFNKIKKVAKHFEYVIRKNAAIPSELYSNVAMLDLPTKALNLNGYLDKYIRTLFPNINYELSTKIEGDSGIYKFQTDIKFNQNININEQMKNKVAATIADGFHNWNTNYFPKDVNMWMVITITVGSTYIGEIKRNITRRTNQMIT